MYSTLMLLIFPLLISANIWDNIFDGEGVPFEVPYNFTTILSPTNFSSLVNYKLLSSTELNGISINTTSPLDYSQTIFSQMKFNFTTGTLVAYSPQKGCAVFQDNHLKIPNFYYLMEGILDFVLLMNSRDMVPPYKKVDVNPLLKILNANNCVKNMALYFLSDTELNLIESEFINGATAYISVESMGQKLTNESEYLPLPDWQCKNMKIIKQNGQEYVVTDSSDNGDQGSDDNDNENSSFDSGQNGNTQQESLIDAILDYLIPINLTDDERQALYLFLESIWANYISCS